MARATGSGTTTVLFTDLVGSTQLMARLGEPVYDELRRGHFAALRDAVTKASGEEVKTTGDGLMAVFPSAANALSCAIAMQQAVARKARPDAGPARTGPGGPALAIRVALALGDVAFEEGDVYGTPVVEAARLVAVTKGGQILATALVRAVAGGRTGATFNDAGPLQLKGLPDAVSVYEVAWEPLGAEPAAVALPALLTRVGQIFVGRDGEVERCFRLWKEAAAGECRVVLVGGEPGIGKTRLAAQLAGALHGEGAVVLAGRCDEDLGVPYQPFVEALRHYLTHAVAPRLGHLGGELARVVPELAEIVPGLPEPLRSDPETERYRLFDAVTAWLADVSADVPILLVMDDLQWAAKPTLLLLRHVLRFPEPMRMLVMATYRDTDVGRGHPLLEFLADSRKEQGYERLTLGGLDRAAVAAFIEAAAGHALPEGEDDPFARVVWAETDGHPLFVAEVIRHLAESGAIERRGGRWVTTGPAEELGLPEGVRDVVGRRLSRLTEETNRALGVASVVGLEFDPAVVRAAGSFGEDELFTALEEATRARLLTEVPPARYRFAHALIRATLYDELSGPRRGALHRRVAEAIEALHGGDLDDHLPALAHYYAEASAPSEPAKAVFYTMRAGDRALAQLAHDEAAAYYRQALELLEPAGNPLDDAQRFELLIREADARARTGDAVSARAVLEGALELARSLSGPDRLATVALGVQRLGARHGMPRDEVVDLLDEARSALAGVGSATEAQVTASLARELAHSVLAQRPRAGPLSERALEVARAAGDSATLASCLLARHDVLWGPGTAAERLGLASEIAEMGRRAGDRERRTEGVLLRANALLELGSTAFRTELAAYLRLAGELRQPRHDYFVLTRRAALALLDGRIGEGERLIEEASALGMRIAEPDERNVRLSQTIGVRWARGGAGGLVELAEQAVAWWVGIPAFSHAVAAGLQARAGALEDARRALTEAQKAGDWRVDRSYMWSVTTAFMVVAASRLGDRQLCADLYEELSPVADSCGVNGAVVCFMGSYAHWAGVAAAGLGRVKDAVAHLEVALATHERLGARAWEAESCVELAGVLGTGGRRYRARAADLAAELGLRAVAARVRRAGA